MPIDSPREPVIYCEIDWLDDGSFTHPNSNLSDRVAGTSRLMPGTLTTQRGRDSARPLGQPSAATASIQVHNLDRLLSPEFAGSDIYQLVVPGRAYRIRMGAGTPVDYDAPIPYDDVVFYDGTAVLSLMTGFLEEPEVASSRPLTATLSALGQLSVLRDGKRVSTPLYQGIRTDQALGYLLDAAGWPAALRTIATGDTTLDLWWLDDADPFSAVLDILASEGAPAAIYESASGRFVFENRNYRAATARSTTSLVTVSDDLVTPVAYDAPIEYDAHVLYDSGSPLMHGSIQYSPNFRDIKNQATYDIARRVQQSLQKVWEYGTALVLTPSESRLITVTLSEPSTNAVAPVSAPVTTVTITGTPTGGTVTITVNGQTTAGINHNSIAATVQTALEALSNVAPGDVVVTGGPGPGTPWVLTWSTAFALSALTVSASGAGLTGGTTPAASASTLGTDYLLSAGALASIPTLESVNAQRLGIRFVAGAGGATVIGVTSNGPQLRAQPWTQVSAETVTNSVDASASIAKTKGVRSLAISGRKELNASYALAITNAAVSYYQNNRPVVHMPIENFDGQHLLWQLGFEVSDRVSIISNAVGLIDPADFWIEQIEHRRQPGKLVTTLICERVLPTDVAIALWDSGLWDIGTWAS